MILIYNLQVLVLLQINDDLRGSYFSLVPFNFEVIGLGGCPNSLRERARNVLMFSEKNWKPSAWQRHLPFSPCNKIVRILLFLMMYSLNHFKPFSDQTL